MRSSLHNPVCNEVGLASAHKKARKREKREEEVASELSNTLRVDFRERIENERPVSHEPQ